jgi:hypothetical protein
MQHAKLLVSIAIMPALVSGAALIIASISTTTNPSSTPLALLGSFASVLLSILASVALVQTIANIKDGISVQDAYKRATPLFFSYFFVAILSALAVILGFILFIIPGVIIGVWFCFVHLTVVLEGKRGREALKASKSHVAGMWFDIFFRLLVLCAVLLSVIVAIVLVLGVFLGDGVVFTAASDLISGAISPFGLVYVYLMYKDVLRIKAKPSEEPMVVLA